MLLQKEPKIIFNDCYDGGYSDDYNIDDDESENAHWL